MGLMSFQRKGREGLAMEQAIKDKVSIRKGGNDNLSVCPLSSQKGNKDFG